MIQKNKKLVGRLGMFIFGLGLVAGIIFQGISTWGLIESTLFNPGMPVDEQLTTMRCPLIITSNEVGIVSASFSNPTEIDRIRIVRANISEGFLTMRREISTNLTLEPGQTRTLEWEVTADDAAWGRYVFVRVYTPRTTALMPAQTKACGILVIHWPGVKGSHIANVLLVLGLLGPIVGLGMWSGVYWPFTEDERKRVSLLGFLTALVLGGIFLSIIDQWIPHLVLLIILFFILVSLATKAIMSGDNIL